MLFTGASHDESACDEDCGQQRLGQNKQEYPPLGKWLTSNGSRENSAEGVLEGGGDGEGFPTVASASYIPALSSCG